MKGTRTQVNFNETSREIEVLFASPPEVMHKEMIDLISLACNYNASFSFSSKTSLFTAKCVSDSASEELLSDYNEYYYSK